MVDVGRLAGVSAQTVSRYFTGGYVGSSARTRIEQAVETLGYRPHAAARRLKSNRPDSIGIIAMGRPNFGVWSIIEGMTVAVREAGYTLVIGQLDIQVSNADLHDEIGKAVDHLTRSDVGGIVVATPYPGGERALRGLVNGIPLIVISERPENRDNSVRSDSYTAGTLAVDHLLDMGHRRILHVSGDPATVEAAERETAYRNALARRDLPPYTVKSQDWTAASGFSVGMTLDPSAFTAIFAANDAIAIGLMSALRERGLIAPGDYSIIGVDSMPESRFTAPPLTSVALDFTRLGELAIHQMLALMRDGRAVQQRSISPHLEIRASTAPPRSFRDEATADQPG